MKLQKYDLRLNKERNKSVLVKECCFSYPGYSLNNPEKIVAALNTAEDMEHLPEEHMYMLAFNSQLNVSGFFHISHGTVNMSVASPREIFLRSVLCNATGIVLIHNHPSGNPTPSQEDRLATQRIHQAGKLMEIPLIDHIIIGAGCYYSFRENDLV